MTKAEPALTPEQWEYFSENDRLRLFVAGDGAVISRVPGALSPAGAIAINNQMLVHNDPRRITRTKVDLLRVVADDLRQALQRPGAPVGMTAEVNVILAIQALADGLESYLPPEEA